MGFRKLDAAPRQALEALTVEEAQQVLDRFAVGLHPWQIAVELGASWFPRRFTVAQVRALCRRFVAVEQALYRIMGGPEAPATATALRAALVAALPHEPAALVQAVGTKIVQVATEAGTWAAFTAALAAQEG